MLRKVLASIGIGGASVDARLASSRVVPGGRLQGEIHLRGGSVPQQIRGVEILVETDYLHERDEHTTRHTCELGRFRLPGEVTLSPGEERVVPFTVEIPRAAPLTIGRQRVWLRTRLDVEGAIDPKDTDDLVVEPAPLQQKLLAAMEQLGFVPTGGRCEKSRHGRGVPFVQEIEMRPQTGPFRGRLDEVDVIMQPAPDGLDVVLEVDRRARGLASFLAEALDADESRFRLHFDEAEAGAPLTRWVARVQQVIAAGA